jgi:hypothetical protein
LKLYFCYPLGVWSKKRAEESLISSFSEMREQKETPS